MLLYAQNIHNFFCLEFHKTRSFDRYCFCSTKLFRRNNFHFLQSCDCKQSTKYVTNSIGLGFRKITCLDHCCFYYAKPSSTRPNWLLLVWIVFQKRFSLFTFALLPKNHKHTPIGEWLKNTEHLLSRTQNHENLILIVLVYQKTAPNVFFCKFKKYCMKHLFLFLISILWSTTRLDCWAKIVHISKRYSRKSCSSDRFVCARKANQ